MDDLFLRSEILLGKIAKKRLENSTVIVFGIGGVGSYAVEALARMGIGEIHLADGDCYSASNMNRQLYATTESIGNNKAEEAAKRINIINPDCKVKAFNINYSAETKDAFKLESYDYIVDAIDSVEDKVLLICNAKSAKTRIISSMGAGNKLDPTRFKVGDIYETSVCPLARVMRSKLKDAGIKELKTVYSTETPIKNTDESVVGSVSFVPSVAGLIIAGEVVKDIIG